MSGVDEDIAALEARARARIGQRLCGKYRIDSVLGVGGMAVVYAATHRNGRRVAVKILHPELSLRAGFRARFVREGQAANAVNHPGVVAVVDDEIAEDGTAFIVMELLEGKVLEKLWEENGRRVATRLVMSLACAVCDVLEAAHKVGIVHRDIKPENLFLTSEGGLKVLDFGLARARDALHTHRTTTGMVLGTPAFMAPEQAMGRTSQIDGQTDLWAVGATMFTLLSGHPVHEGESVQHLMVLAATEPPRSLRTVMPDAAPALVTLVDRALMMNKAHRWPSAAALKTAICDASIEIFGEPPPDLATAGDITQVHRFAHIFEREPSAVRMPDVQTRPAATQPSARPRVSDDHDADDAPTGVRGKSDPDPDDADDLPTSVRRDLNPAGYVLPAPQMPARTPLEAPEEPDDDIPTGVHRSAAKLAAVPARGQRARAARGQGRPGAAPTGTPAPPSRSEDQPSPPRRSDPFVKKKEVQVDPHDEDEREAASTKEKLFGRRRAAPSAPMLVVAPPPIARPPTPPQPVPAARAGIQRRFLVGAIVVVIASAAVGIITAMALRAHAAAGADEAPASRPSPSTSASPPPSAAAVADPPPSRVPSKAVAPAASPAPARPDRRR